MSRVLLKTTSLWTRDIGLKADGEILGQDNLVASEDFSAGALDPALWGSSMAGGGNISMAGGLLTLETLAASDAAIVYYKQTLNPRATSKWKLRLKYESPLSANTINPFVLFQDSIVPAVGNYVGKYNLKELVRLRRDTAASQTFFYYDTGGTLRAFTFAWEFLADTIYYLDIENDGAGHIKLTVYDEDLKELAGVMFAWSNVRAEADDLYFFFGDPYQDYAFGTIKARGFWHWGEYPSGKVAVMGQIDVGAVIEGLPITEDSEAGASIAWRYDRDGAGFVMPGAGTLAELKAAVEGEYFNTLDLEATFISDGDAQASFDINGGVLAGYGATYNMPLEIIEGQGLEVVEL